MNTTGQLDKDTLAGLEPPERLNVAWLVACASLGKDDEERLLDEEDWGHTIEEMHEIKRAGKWSSFHLMDQRLLEREYRFYTELGRIFAQSETASFRAKPPPLLVEKQKQTFAMDAISKRNLRHSQHPGKNIKDKSGIVGCVRDVSAVKSIGTEGCFEVLRPRVSIHTAPSVKASLVGVLPRYTFVRGLAFAAEDGEPWLLLHKDTLADEDLHRDVAFVPIASKYLGCGSLLKRLPGDPEPARDAWRLSKPKEPEEIAPSSIERWKRLTQRRMLGALRVPICVAAAYKNHYSTFLLVLEKLAAPEWVSADVAQGCSVNQAVGAIIALAGMHSTFCDPSKLSGQAWLPHLPLHEENIGQVQKIYSEQFNRHREDLSECMSASAFAVCEKLCILYSDIARRLLQPPLTLLHGNFQPSVLRFAATSNLPIVTAYDWQFVSVGRAGYDFAMFIALFAPPHVRREYELELMVRYLMARDTYGTAAREAFKEDVRIGLLVAFVFYFLNNAGMIGTDCVASTEVLRHIEWFSIVMDDWNCEDCVGGTGIDSPKAAKPKRAYKKKSRRRPVSPQKTEKKPEKKPEVQEKKSIFARRCSINPETGLPYPKI